MGQGGALASWYAVVLEQARVRKSVKLFHCDLLFFEKP